MTGQASSSPFSSQPQPTSWMYHYPTSMWYQDWNAQEKEEDARTCPKEVDSGLVASLSCGNENMIEGNVPGILKSSVPSPEQMWPSQYLHSKAILVFLHLEKD